jgi:ABC-2 type transport system ATP-binding protein
MLKVRNLTKRFGRTRVLDGVSFELAPGEVLALIGPNGSGKTTLLECLAGLLSAESGEVTFDGSPLPVSRRSDVLFYLPDSVTPWAAERAGFVLDVMARLLGGERAVPELVQALELSEVLPSRIGALSKGQRKRLLLALALLAPRRMLLLDEPFDGLDLRQTRAVIGLLRRHAARTGRSLLVSAHGLTDAARVSDRLLLLSGGRAVGQGTLDELRQRAGLPAADLEEVFLALG